MSGTCLFTGKPLDESTKIEHTIPRSLCGRIRSNTVTCSEFNEAASKCDAELRQEFVMLLSTLAPVLPSEFNPGEVPVILDNKIPAIKKDGFIDIRRFHIVEKTQFGRPKEVYHSLKSTTIEKDQKKLGLKSKIEQIIPLPGEMAYIPNIPICSNQAVISILKSILCSIDAILQEEKQEPFTRTQEMKPILNFVNNYISKPLDDKGIAELDKYYLGIQLEDQKDFEKSLSFHHYNAKPFEHVIVFSSNTATKTLDAAWNIFSHEVHGVRLATPWTGPRVCGFIANPIFKDETVSYAICPDIENPFLKIQKTKIKGFGSYSEIQYDFFYYPVLLRQQTYYDAVFFVETNNDIHLIEMFRETSKYTDQTTLFEVLFARLRKHFKDSYKDTLEQEFKTLEERYEVWKDKPVRILFDEGNPLLPKFINDYKEAFSSLVQAFYPPSKIVHKVSCEIKPAK